MNGLSASSESPVPTTDQPLEARVAHRWGYAIFFYLLGVMPGFLVVFACYQDPSFVTGLLHEPLRFLIPWIGTVILLYAVIALPYMGLSILVRRCRIADGILTLVEPFRSRSVDLKQLASIRIHIKVLHSRSGNHLQPYLNISDKSGGAVSLPLHTFEYEGEIATRLLEAANSQQIVLADEPRHALEKASSSAYLGELAPTPVASRLKSGRTTTWLLLLVMVAPALGLLGWIWLNPPVSVPPGAVNVSDEFMRDLSTHNIAAAKQLESPKLRSDAEQNHYLATENFSDFAQGHIIDKSSGRDENGAYVSVIYEIDSGKRPFYVKLSLTRYSGAWRVWLLQTAYTKLKP